MTMPGQNSSTGQDQQGQNPYWLPQGFDMSSIFNSPQMGGNFGTPPGLLTAPPQYSIPQNLMSAPPPMAVNPNAPPTGLSPQEQARYAQVRQLASLRPA